MTTVEVRKTEVFRVSLKHPDSLLGDHETLERAAMEIVDALEPDDVVVEAKVLDRCADADEPAAATVDSNGDAVEIADWKRRMK